MIVVIVVVEIGIIYAITFVSENLVLIRIEIIVDIGVPLLNIFQSFVGIILTIDRKACQNIIEGCPKECAAKLHLIHAEYT